MVARTFGFSVASLRMVEPVVVPRLVYSIGEFSSKMALAEIGHTVETAAEPGHFSCIQLDKPGFLRDLRLRTKGMSALRSPTRRWTPDEERKLDAMLDADKEAAEIAVALNRTRQAVYARLQRLYRKRAFRVTPVLG
jgi:hypothetical protein